MSDGVNIEELDYLTRQFYLGHDPDESEQAILDSIANEFINEKTVKLKDMENHYQPFLRDMSILFIITLWFY